MTTIGEALLELKIMKSELSRHREMRSNTFKYYADDIPEEDCEDITEQIQELTTKIRKLKIRIETTNHKVFVVTSEGKMTIAGTIHFIGDMRSELSSLESLRDSFKKAYWESDEKSRKTSYQLSQTELNKKIADLEKKKVRLDAFLQTVNYKTELIGDE